MGRYDFDEIVDRTGTDCLKYDFAVRRGRPADVLPFWVADMDFRIAKEIEDAIVERARHGIFGYTDTTGSYEEAIVEWYRRRFGWTPDAKWIVKTPGVVFALAMAIRAYTQPEDGVLIQRPVYYPFSGTIEANGRHLINSPLAFDGDRWRIDFDDLEHKLVTEHVKLMFLCNPHNPVGRVWTADELRRVGDLCIKYDVVIVSDEIHADFAWEGHPHTVFAALGEEYAARCLVCTAPSKTFNLAGLQTSNIFIPDRALRKAFIAEIERAGYSQLNTLGLTACEAAYRYGEAWLDEARAYIYDNLIYAAHYMEHEIPGIKPYVPEGTYLLWFDCAGLGMTPRERERFLLEDAKLWLDSGDMFGSEGSDFERINVACPRAVLTEGLERLKRAVSKL